MRKFFSQGEIERFIVHLLYFPRVNAYAVNLRESIKSYGKFTIGNVGTVKSTEVNGIKLLVTDVAPLIVS